MARLGVRLKDNDNSDLRRNVVVRGFNERAVELFVMTAVFVILIAAVVVSAVALLRG